jgi:hypothetical protein
MIYSPKITLGEARAEYFRLNNFGEDGGYKERWIKTNIWRIPIRLPNTEGRRKAVKLHDLHHVLTEYPTTWRGEAEISAWEVGSGGLRRYYAGWWLDVMNMAQGLVVNPRGLYRGFMRGRSSSNLYSREFSDELLEHEVGEYRRLLSLDRPPNVPGFRDHLLFAFWIWASIALYLASVLGGPVVLALAVWWFIWRY